MFKKSSTYRISISLTNILIRLEQDQINFRGEETAQSNCCADIQAHAHADDLDLKVNIYVFALNLKVFESSILIEACFFSKEVSLEMIYALMVNTNHSVILLTMKRS